MDLAIPVPDDLRARTGVALYTAPQILRIGIGRRMLRMTCVFDRLLETAGT